ncbi:serine/threonine-protein phosphatase 2A regulatory subunit A [Nematocida sp. AWRm80]|nr:serine/threonine-protein phosphatase 2A regulatory subunit A [Nematocida sp. AWRm80]
MPETLTVSYDEIEREIEGMHSADPKERERSLDKLYTIAQQIGNTYTLQYMLPFIKGILDTNEDAKRPVIAQMDKIVIDVVKEIRPVFPIYKELLLTRDDAIRKDAAEGIVTTTVRVGRMKNLLEHVLFELEEFICAIGDSRFIMHRISAISLIKKFITEIQPEVPVSRIRTLFKKLLGDQSSLVRKRALSETDILAAFYSNEELVELIEHTLQDPEDSVRGFFVYALGIIPRTDTNMPLFFKAFNQAAKDSSWRVRNGVCRSMVTAVSYMHLMRPEEKNAIIQLMKALVTDKEETVRSTIIKQMPNILQESSELLEGVIASVNQGSQDTSPEVRQIVPEALSQIAAIISEEEIEQYILPIVHRLLRDQDRKTKMETISKLKTLYNKLGTVAITDALAQVANDLESTNWRTRTAVLKSISCLSQQIDKGCFEEHLRTPFFKMFTDQIWAVRKEAAQILGEISVVFGMDWVNTTALPSLIYLKTSKHYAHRISFVTALGALLQTLWPKEIQAEIHSHLLDLAHDPIPQVRLTVAKITKYTSHLENPQEILSVLEKDMHPDVIQMVYSNKQSPQGI